MLSASVALALLDSPLMNWLWTPERYRLTCWYNQRWESVLVCKRRMCCVWPSNSNWQC